MLLWWLQEDLPAGTLEMNEAALMESPYFEEEALQSWLDTIEQHYWGRLR
jgi:hypothetical protein